MTRTRLATLVRARDLLVKARDYLSDPNHWIKSRFYAPSYLGSGPRYCAIGAIEGMLKHTPGAGPATARSARRCLDTGFIQRYGYSAITINDNSHTRHDEILDGYDQAILMLDLELEKVGVLKDGVVVAEFKP